MTAFTTEQQLMRTLRFVAAGCAAALALFFFLPWISGTSDFGQHHSYSFYDMTFDQNGGDHEYQASLFYWLALGVVFIACIPCATLREELARARIRVVAFGFLAAIALEYLMIVAFLDPGDANTGGAGLWLALIAAIGGAGASVWATVAVEPGADEAAVSTATTMCLGLTWGGMIAFLLLDFLDTLENISNGRISHEFAGDARMINIIVIAVAVGIGLAPKIVRSMRAAGQPAGVSAWNYAPVRGGSEACGATTQAIPALAPASAYAATATQVIAPPVPALAQALEPCVVVTTRYNGVVVWDDWRNLVNPLERLPANARLDVVGQVEGYFEVQAGARRGYVAKGAVR